MGVSGSGKSEVGARLAAALHGTFSDADGFHPPENVAKMSAGTPLTDADRWPWLQRLRDGVVDACPAGATHLLACSALRRSYRDFLRATRPDAVRFVFLDGSYDEIFARMQHRAHFMRESMLRSQFDALERPHAGETDVIRVNADQPLDDVVADALRRLTA